MNAIERLNELQTKALRDEELRRELLASRTFAEPLVQFCSVSQKAGVELYPMEIINAGEEFYASMRRSTNGGGENAPMLDGEDDFYELFLAALS